MLNIFIGFEQTNKYVICWYPFLNSSFFAWWKLIRLANEVGETLGFIAEEPRGLLASFSRQILRTHRPFRAVIMDREGTPVLWVWSGLFSCCNRTSPRCFRYEGLSRG
jgi:Scramblase